MNRFRHVAISLTHRAHPLTHRALSELEATILSTPGELAALRQRKLRSTLAYAAKHSPFYRDRLIRAGAISRSGEVRLENFQLIEPTSKGDIRDHWREMIVPGRGAIWNASGGSTGEPVRVLQCPDHRAWARALKLIFDKWSGYKVGEPKVLLWGSERDLRFSAGDLRRRAFQWLKNESFLNSFRMPIDTQKAFISTIQQIQPKQILAYAESAFELAQTAQALGKSVTLSAGSSIMTSASPLTSSMRDVIENQFKAPVFNRYGCREFGDIAGECFHHNGLHIAVPKLEVEVVDDRLAPASPGATGELLITSHTNAAMPLIRYRIGDLGSISSGSCLCGCPWPLLQDVSGRTSDYIYDLAMNAFRLPSSFFASRKWVARYQAEQTKPGHLTVSVVPVAGNQVAPSTVHDLERDIAHHLGSGFQVAVVLRDKIAASSSGKHRTVISLVNKGCPTHD